MIITGTGYLYNWGYGISGSNYIPSQITGSIFSNVNASESFNAAINHPSTTTTNENIVNNNILSIPSFGVSIFSTTSYSIPIKKFNLISTFSGYSGSTINGTGYVSGEDFVKKLTFITKANSNNVNTDIGILSFGKTLGTGSGKYYYPQDTFLNIKKNNLDYAFNDAWTGYSGSFIKYNKTGFSGTDAGIVINDIGGTNLGLKPEFNTYEIIYGSNDIFLSGYPVKQNINFEKLGVNFPQINIQTSTTTSNNKVWASYNIESGIKNNSKNVFAYSIEFVDKIQLSNDQIILLESKSSGDLYSGYKNLLLPIIHTGFESSFATYSGYCFNSLECPESKDTELEGKIECFTGQSIDSREYQIFISGVKKKYKDQVANTSKQYDFASPEYLEDKPSLSNFFSMQTGEIIYNSFFTGDTINFNLYNYDYTGLYKKYHLNNNPIYPNTGFSLVYPNDFYNIDTLINKLNLHLNYTSYPIWYPYDCLSGEASGIYITGGLMNFYKDTGILSGTLNYNNIIKFRSLRNYASGFNINLNLVNRDVFISNFSNEKIKRGFSYLIPDVIELQAFTGNQWLVLDRRSGLYKDLTGLASKLVPSIYNVSLLGVENEILSTSDVQNPELTGEQNIELQPIFQTGGFDLVETFTQNIYLNNTTPEYCASAPPQSRDIDIYHVYGWPSETTDCPPEPPIQKDKQKEEQEPSGLTGSKYLNLFLNIKRTGWLLDPTGIYLNCLTSPDYDPFKIQFSEYRIVSKNFSGYPFYYNEYLVPKNEVYFANINLFSLKQSEFSGIFTGESKCLIGSDYVADIQDYVKVPFFNNFNYSITGENRSGIYKVLNQQLTYTPTGNEINIKFIRSSGKVVGNVTGIFSSTLTGTGIIQHEYNDRYFYNPNTQEISFKTLLSGYATGTGILTGKVFAIKQDVVNQELLFGNRLTVLPQYKQLSSNGIATGLLKNQQYLQSGVIGFYYLTGNVSGLSNSGYFNYTTGITGLANLSDNNNLPYYPLYTGLNQASGIVNFNFNNISNFDSIIINNFAISYNDDTGNYQSPSFFNNINTLNTIINNNEINFACTSKIFNNTGIILTASTLYALGDSGNSISTSANGNGIFVSQSFLSGGKTFYPLLNPTGVFSGTDAGSIAATGFYYETGSGAIIGNISSFSGKREFSGIWNIKTGKDFTLKQLSLVNGNQYINSGNFDINNILFLNLTYNNQLNINDNTYDVAELKIKDNNFITAYNQGSINTGTTGELIFRITGNRYL